MQAHPRRAVPLSRRTGTRARSVVGTREKLETFPKTGSQNRAFDLTRRKYKNCKVQLVMCFGWMYFMGKQRLLLLLSAAT
jgi:hypothetical protein